MIAEHTPLEKLGILILALDLSQQSAIWLVRHSWRVVPCILRLLLIK